MITALRLPIACLTLTMLWCFTAPAFSQSGPPQPKRSPAFQMYKVQLDELNGKLVEQKQRAIEFTETRKLKIEMLDELHISEASFTEILKTLQTQRIQLLIDLDGLNARKMAIESNRDRAKRQANHQEIIGLAKKVKANAETKLERTLDLYQRKSSSIVQVSEAECEVLEAELRLAETIREFNKDSAESTRDRSQVLIELAERKARLVTVEKLLKQLVPTRTVVEEVSRLNGQIKGTNSRQIDLANQIERLQKKLQQLDYAADALDRE